MCQRAGAEPAWHTELHFSQVILQSHVFRVSALEKQAAAHRKKGTGMLVPWYQWDNLCVSKVSHEVKSAVETRPQLSDLTAK